ncbi:MAG: hypothetical protein WBN40_11820 [Pseudomonadales bacterium]
MISGNSYSRAGNAGKSRSVTSNQAGVHKKLAGLVQKYSGTRSKRPLSTHSLRNFEAVLARADGRNLIFDSGCGTGMSTGILARRNPYAFVVGIDKSAKRLAAKGNLSTLTREENLMLLRADLVDFLRAASRHGARLEKHYFLYPNPWPKSCHVQRRWHASPVFREILELGGAIELRTNWATYAEEFSLALKIAGIESTMAPLEIEHGQALTPFERKYHASGQTLWQLLAPNQ